MQYDIIYDISTTATALLYFTTLYRITLPLPPFSLPSFYSTQYTVHSTQYTTVKNIYMMCVLLPRYDRLAQPKPKL